eukprot:CAMPEP_0171074236 /NCGR_PEP_ID=MMETSP0766_2-20121228/12010_1 /TAXON_ID=439317 /ORGANISM="Gambierdiscus australes, Strain CAWD 149" /LENGTH=37 /DNA_ID= /DNA_START= /DNA_END= /DNA_ORIENTATION=
MRFRRLSLAAALPVASHRPTSTPPAKPAITASGATQE